MNDLKATANPIENEEKLVIILTRLAKFYNTNPRGDAHGNGVFVCPRTVWDFPLLRLLPSLFKNHQRPSARQDIQDPKPTSCA